MKNKIKPTLGRISLNKRIAMKCLGCAGSAKEVTLCHLFDCPLWAVRFGCTMKSKVYEERIRAAEKNFTRDVKELSDMGINMADFRKEHKITAFPE